MSLPGEPSAETVPAAGPAPGCPRAEGEPGAAGARGVGDPGRSLRQTAAM